MNDKTVIYIAGPISNMPNLNRDAFQEADEALKRKGYITRNPHVFCSDIQALEPNDPAYYRRGLRVLADECTDILLLPGWEQSQGAYIEFNVAKLCRLTIHTDIVSLFNHHQHDEEQ